MLNKILMPSGGQTTDELIILQWNKKVGDHVKRGDILFEIETDKAILTVESFAEGTLLQISYGEGALVKSGETVAYIGETGDALPSKITEAAATEDNQQMGLAVEEKPEIKPEGKKIHASPLAKSQAREENINLEDVARHVSKNLIKKNDIREYLDHIRNGKDASENDCYFIDATPMRKAIARRMKESVSTSPHYTVSVDIDMTETVILRQKLHDSSTNGLIKISYNDFLIKVAAKAIESHPLINAVYQDDRIKVFKDVHFGLAIAVEGGLIVPVIKNANKKSLLEVAQASAQAIAKSKSGKVGETDISGGTITLSNLGMYGMKEFTAIINQPQSCILAVGAIIEKPVSVNRKVTIRDIMNITASFDHRVIDGAVGAAFLQEVKKILENPHLLVL